MRDYCLCFCSNCFLPQDEHTIAKEEIFGPVMSILKFKTIDEVIQRANSSMFGLGTNCFIFYIYFSCLRLTAMTGAGVVTRSVDNALKIANGLRTGTVYVNCYDVFDSNTPFGGFKVCFCARVNIF
jgi:aldehyde dehydrogenase (NAD+)